MGKSTLFNRLVGERLAIVADAAGTTRDRLYGDVEFAGREFLPGLCAGGSEDRVRAEALTRGAESGGEGVFVFDDQDARRAHSSMRTEAPPVG